MEKLLAQTSLPLPTIDPSSVKVKKGVDRAAVEDYIGQAVAIFSGNNPFPADYSIEKFLDDASTGNRDMLERLKVALEIIDRQVSALEVPEQALTPHIHALAIVRGGAEAVAQLLAAPGDSDATLQFIGRTVFVWNEVRALLKEVQVALGQ